MGDWRQQWTVSYQAWGGQYSREKNCLINWSHTRSTGEMSLKNSARLCVTEYGQNCLRGLEDSDGKETGGWARKPPHSWLSKPPSPTPVNSNEPLLHAQLMASRIRSSWEQSSHVREGVLPEPGRLSGHRSCQPHTDHRPLLISPREQASPGRTCLPCWREWKMHSHSGKQAVSCKTRHTLTIEPRNLSPGYVSRRNADRVHTKTWVWKIMTALFVMPPNWTDVLLHEGQVRS